MCLIVLLWENMKFVSNKLSLKRNVKYYNSACLFWDWSGIHVLYILIFGHFLQSTRFIYKFSETKGTNGMTMDNINVVQRQFPSEHESLSILKSRDGEFALLRPLIYTKILQGGGGISCFHGLCTPVGSSPEFITGK